MGDFLNPPPETALRAMRGPESLGQGQTPDPPWGSEPPADAFGRLMKFLAGYPTHVQESIVTGTGRDAMKAAVTPRLFQYLDKAPQRFIASESDLKGIAGGAYNPFHPKSESGVLGTIQVDPAHSGPVAWNHEAMHAANDLTRLNRGMREIEKNNLPMTQYDLLGRNTPMYQRGYTMNTGEAREMPSKGFMFHGEPTPYWTSPTDEAFLAAMKQPGMMAYHEKYADTFPWMEPDRLKLEAINEWQARNSLKKQPPPMPPKQYKNEWYTPEQMASEDSSITTFIKRLLGGQ